MPRPTSLSSILPRGTLQRLLRSNPKRPTGAGHFYAYIQRVSHDTQGR